MIWLIVIGGLMALTFVGIIVERAQDDAQLAMVRGMQAPPGSPSAGALGSFGYGCVLVLAFVGVVSLCGVIAYVSNIGF